MLNRHLLSLLKLRVKNLRSDVDVVGMLRNERYVSILYAAERGEKFKRSQED